MSSLIKYPAIVWDTLRPGVNVCNNNIIFNSVFGRPSGPYQHEILLVICISVLVGHKHNFFCVQGLQDLNVLIYIWCFN